MKKLYLLIAFWLLVFNVQAQFAIEKINFESANPYSFNDIITDLDKQKKQKVFGELVIPKDSIDDGKKYLLLDGTIGIECPSILLHGMQDVEVPWETSIRLANALASKDVRVMLVKSGDHRLSSDQELALLGEHLLRLLGEIGVVA